MLSVKECLEIERERGESWPEHLKRMEREQEEIKRKKHFDNPNPTAAIRKFETGATRDSDEGKNDYEGFLSPLFLEGYGDYMTEHRRQSDGSLRGSDNWQKGIPKEAYQKSLIRHVFTAWALWRGWPVKAEKIGGVLRQPTLLEALYGVAFNVMGLVHELRKEQQV